MNKKIEKIPKTHERHETHETLQTAKIRRKVGSGGHDLGLAQGFWTPSKKWD
jgi:hypothetical protein